jgi:hypothetical protein
MLEETAEYAEKQEAVSASAYSAYFAGLKNQNHFAHDSRGVEAKQFRHSDFGFL